MGGWVGGGGNMNMRNLRKSIDYLLIFISEWMNGDWCAYVTLSLPFSVWVCVCVFVCV